jgi:hypothetical protein
MAITATPFKPKSVPGSEYMTVTDVQMDSSYAGGGETLTPSDLGSLRRVTFALCQVRVGPEAEEYVGEAWYHVASEKLKLNNVKTGKEVEAGKDMSKVNVRVVAFGK